MKQRGSGLPRRPAFARTPVPIVVLHIFPSVAEVRWIVRIFDGLTIPYPGEKNNGPCFTKRRGPFPAFRGVSLTNPTESGERDRNLAVFPGFVDSLFSILPWFVHHFPGERGYDRTINQTNLTDSMIFLIFTITTRQSPGRMAGALLLHWPAKAALLRANFFILSQFSRKWNAGRGNLRKFQQLTRSPRYDTLEPTNIGTKEAVL